MNAKELTLKNIQDNSFVAGKSVKGKGLEVFEANRRIMYIYKDFSDKVIFKKLRENNSSNTVLLIASLGLATVIQSLLAIFFSNQFQTLSSNNGVYKTYSAITQN